MRRHHVNARRGGRPRRLTAAWPSVVAGRWGMLGFERFDKKILSDALSLCLGLEACRGAVGEAIKHLQPTIIEGA